MSRSCSLIDGHIDEPMQRHIDAINGVIKNMEADERINNKKYLISLLKEIILRLEINNVEKL